MKIGGYAQTFILLGMILFIGFVSSLFIINECVENHSNKGMRGSFICSHNKI